MCDFLVTCSQCFQVCAVVHGHGAEGLRPENSPPRGSSWRFDTTTRPFSSSVCLSASKLNSQIVHVGHKVELQSKPTNQSSYSAGLGGKFLYDVLNWLWTTLTGAGSIIRTSALSGHTEVVHFLLEGCRVNPVPRDRWVHTPSSHSTVYMK